MNDLLQGAEIQSKKPSSSQLALQKFRHYLDHVAGGLVLLNSILLMVQLELEGRQLALELGLPEGESFESMMPIFSALDTMCLACTLWMNWVRSSKTRWQRRCDQNRSFGTKFCLRLLGGAPDPDRVGEMSFPKGRLAHGHVAFSVATRQGHVRICTHTVYTPLLSLAIAVTTRMVGQFLGVYVVDG